MAHVVVVKGGLPGKAVVVATGEKPGGQDCELSVDFVLCPVLDGEGEGDGFLDSLVVVVVFV